MLSSTRHNRPQTMDLFVWDLVIDCDIGLNVVCGVKNRIDKLVRIRRAPL